MDELKENIQNLKNRENIPIIIAPKDCMVEYVNTFVESLLSTITISMSCNDSDPK